jgi:hypothetical protein
VHYGLLNKNFAYRNLNSEKVMRWRLLIEENSPGQCYITGDKNIAADAIGRLPKQSTPLENFQKVYY